MLRLTGILGRASEPALAQRLHDLEHEGAVEYLILEAEYQGRHRLHATTDRGTECAILLPRSLGLSDGAVLLLEPHRAIVVRLAETRWLGFAPRDAAAALELGYFAGNMHWPVRFRDGQLLIALNGPPDDYRARLAELLADGRIRQVDDE